MYGMEPEEHNWARKLVHKLDYFEDSRPKITGKASGEGNHNYILEDENAENYVLRVSKEVSDDRLENEYRTPNFLEDQNIDQIPRALEFKQIDDKPVLLETFVGETNLDKNNIENNHLEKMAELLAQVHNIPIEEYNDFFDEDEQETIKLREFYRKDFEQWSQRPFQEYLNHAEEPDNRLLKFHKKQRELLEREELEIQVTQAFCHGDLGFNLRSSGDQVFLIDWEFARIGYPVHEILYFFQHEKLSEEQKQVFLDAYQKHRDLAGIDNTREIYKKFLAFNDAVWAAKRHAKTGEERYSKLLEERLQHLEKLYN